MLSPFMPVASEAIRSQLGIDGAKARPAWEDLAWGGLPAGTRVSAPQPIFPRIQDLTVTEEVLRALASSSESVTVPPMTEERSNSVSDQPQGERAAAAPGTPVAPAPSADSAQALIGIEDFMKVDLRVGEVLAAEPVPNATKLLRLTVQLGEDDTRTILAGIAEYYQPDALIGRQVVVVANLLPRKMRGIESQGMLLAADVDGQAVLLLPDSPAPPGSRVR
jgi:methionyl-tRNA synthetase